MHIQRARNTDPIGSHAAAQRVTDTGVAHTQAMTVLDAIRKYPGLSTLALSKASGIDRYVCGRRASELLKSELVWRVEDGKCTASGHTAALWYPSEGTK